MGLSVDLAEAVVVDNKHVGSKVTVAESSASDSANPSSASTSESSILGDVEIGSIVAGIRLLDVAAPETDQKSEPIITKDRGCCGNCHRRPVGILPLPPKAHISDPATQDAIKRSEALSNLIRLRFRFGDIETGYAWLLFGEAHTCIDSAFFLIRERPSFLDEATNVAEHDDINILYMLCNQCVAALFATTPANDGGGTEEAKQREAMPVRLGSVNTMYLDSQSPYQVLNELLFSIRASFGTSEQRAALTACSSTHSLIDLSKQESIVAHIGPLFHINLSFARQDLDWLLSLGEF